MKNAFQVCLYDVRTCTYKYESVLTMEGFMKVLEFDNDSENLDLLREVSESLEKS